MDRSYPIWLRYQSSYSIWSAKVIRKYCMLEQIPYFATKNHEISDLIQCTIYPDLIDGENTTKYSNVLS